MHACSQGLHVSTLTDSLVATMKLILVYELRKSLDTYLIVDTYVSMPINCPCIISWWLLGWTVEGFTCFS